jgi:hypothetical protein
MTTSKKSTPKPKKVTKPVKAIKPVKATKTTNKATENKGPILDFYFPIQPVFTGNWYDTNRVGEGFHLDVLKNSNGSYDYFLNAYFINDATKDQVWYTAGGNAAQSFSFDTKSHEFVLMKRESAGGDPISAGSMWVEFDGDTANVKVLVNRPDGPIVRETVYRHLTKPIAGNPTACAMPGVIFSPPPPLGEFCYAPPR